MIQDLEAGVFRNEFSMRRKPEDEDYVFAFRGKEVLICTKDIDGDGVRDISIPRVKDVRAIMDTAFSNRSAADGTASFPGQDAEDIAEGEDTGDAAGKAIGNAAFLQYLFTVSGKACFLWMNEDPTAEAPESEGFRYEQLNVFRKSRPQDLSFAGETAFQLFAWYRDNRYCGRCGGKMRFGDIERNMICPACGNMSFPRIMPAVIVGVINGDKILETKYRGREYKGAALIAGFCEIGETGEETARREVMEETGVRVKNIRYYKSQPWGFDSDLLLGYYCDLDGDDTITIEEDELSYGEWVDRSEITEIDQNLSLTNDMIVHFKEYGSKC